MKSDWIRVGWREGIFLVCVKTGRDKSSSEDECRVIRQFNDPQEAMKYAAALMDGMKLTNGEAFAPTNWFQDVMATQEALTAMSGMLVEQLNSNGRG